MDIKGVIYCMFEQSGVFRDAFRKLGYTALDFDIDNQFGKTDMQLDLFDQIESAYNGHPSMFDDILSDDLVLAFFPCIHFSAMSQVNILWDTRNYRNMSDRTRADRILAKIRDREFYLSLMIRLFVICIENDIRLIVENPYSPVGYLFYGQTFPWQPTFIDWNRNLSGDAFRKPTAYWFINCEPTDVPRMEVKYPVQHVLRAKPSTHAGLCSLERSFITPEYAHNFIVSRILGKKETYSQLNLFES